MCIGPIGLMKTLESELLELITFIRVNRRRYVHMPLSDVKREFVLPLLATTAI